MVSDGTVLRVWNWCVNTTVKIEKSNIYTSTITFSVINRTAMVLVTIRRDKMTEKMKLFSRRYAVCRKFGYRYMFDGIIKVIVGVARLGITLPISMIVGYVEKYNFLFSSSDLSFHRIFRICEEFCL